MLIHILLLDIMHICYINFYLLVGLTVDTYEQLDALATCFPWCAVPQEPPQPCKLSNIRAIFIILFLMLY